MRYQKKHKLRESYHCSTDSTTISLQNKKQQLDGTETYLRHQRYNLPRNYYSREKLLSLGLFRLSRAIYQ